MPYQFQLKNIAKSLYDSLQKDPFYQTLEETISDDSNQSKEAMLKYYDYSMLAAQKYGELILPKNNTFGASVWSKPKGAKLTNEIYNQKKTFLEKYLGAKSLNIYVKF